MLGDKENEEDDDVHTVLAVLVGPEQGPDEQHGRTGGSHPAGEDGPEGRACPAFTTGVPTS